MRLDEPPSALDAKVRAHLRHEIKAPQRKLGVTTIMVTHDQEAADMSAVVFLYATHTALASVAVLNMDDAGDIAPAAAMGMMIFYTNVAVRLAHGAVSARLIRRGQAWRRR